MLNYLQLRTSSYLTAAIFLSLSFSGLSAQQTGKSDTNQTDTILNEKKIDEVVLIGYGSQQKRATTTAVQRVTAKDFHPGMANFPLDIIQGEVPGLSITRTNNNPNSGPSIQLRGVTSLTGDTSPLIVIDGVPGGNMDLLKSNDIETIDILKSGAAAAIYGSRGNNGVILITTKKGKEGRSQFQYFSQISKDFAVDKPKFLSASQYREAIKEGLISPTQDLGATTDIYNELLNKANLSQYHDFVASGGGKNNSFRTSLFYQKFDGIAKENNREQYGFRINYMQSGLNNKLKFQTNIASNFNHANLLGGGDFGAVADWNPTAPIYAPYSQDVGTKLPNQGRYGFYQPPSGSNPFSNYATHVFYRYQQTFSGDVRLSYEVIKDLIITAAGSYQTNRWNDREYKTSQNWDQYNPGSPWHGTGWARKANHNDYDKTFEPTITYKKEIGQHSFNLLGGYSYEYATSEDNGMDAGGFTTDGFKDWNFGAATAITDKTLPRPNLSSHKEDNKLIAWFGRLDYSFKDRYYFQASLRHEGSSRFGTNHKWGNFPSISGGWIVSDESFMSNIKFLYFLKARIGYGVTGNQGIPNYQSLVTLGTGGTYPVYLNGATTPTYYQTYGPNVNPNPDLKWEEKKELDFGIDYGLFSNRVTGTFDFYNRRTENLLLSYTVPLPPFVQNTIYTNVGVIRNRGIEFSIQGDVIRAGDLKWNMNFNFSHQKNKLVTLSNQVFHATYLSGGGLGNPGNLGDAIRNMQGGTIGDFYGRRFAGINAAGQWLFYDKDNNVVLDNQITDDDKAVIGNGQPKYYLALTNTVTYKNFDFSIFFRGKFDYDILNTMAMFYGNQSLFSGNVLTSALGEFSNIKAAPQYSNYYLENGDFVKLDNITLGYTFNMKNSNYLSKVRVWLSAKNVATFTGYTGRDPEVSDTGLFPGIDSRDFYPRTTTFTAGLEVNF